MVKWNGKSLNNFEAETQRVDNDLSEGFNENWYVYRHSESWTKKVDFKEEGVVKNSLESAR